MVVTYVIQNRYKQGRAGAIAIAGATLEMLGIAIDPECPGSYSGGDWDARVSLSDTSITTVVKVYDRPDLDIELDMPFLTISQSSDPRIAPQW